MYDWMLNLGACGCGCGCVQPWSAAPVYPDENFHRLIFVLIDGILQNHIMSSDVSDSDSDGGKPGTHAWVSALQYRANSRAFPCYGLVCDSGVLVPFAQAGRASWPPCAECQVQTSAGSLHAAKLSFEQALYAVHQQTLHLVSAWPPSSATEMPTHQAWASLIKRVRLVDFVVYKLLRARNFDVQSAERTSAGPAWHWLLYAPLPHCSQRSKGKEAVPGLRKHRGAPQVRVMQCNSAAAVPGPDAVAALEEQALADDIRLAAELFAYTGMDSTKMTTSLRAALLWNATVCARAATVARDARLQAAAMEQYSLARAQLGALPADNAVHLRAEVSSVHIDAACVPQLLMAVVDGTVANLVSVAAHSQAPQLS